VGFYIIQYLIIEELLPKNYSYNWKDRVTNEKLCDRKAIKTACRRRERIKRVLGRGHEAYFPVVQTFIKISVWFHKHDFIKDLFPNLI
jgi:hypothetical protein